MMVKRLRRSVNPIFEVSTPSTRIRPSVASTNLKNDSANVLFPDPVLPRIPTLRLQISTNSDYMLTQANLFAWIDLKIKVMKNIR